MNKILCSGIVVGMSLAFLCMACSPLSTPEAQPETETPVQTTSPSETATRVISPTASPTETGTPEPLPTASPEPVTSTPQFAPMCDPDVASTLTAPLCQHSIAEQSSSFCMSKKPYNVILMDSGATYELLTQGFTCSDAGTKDERQMIICNGPIGTSFELRVCGRQACALPTLSAESSQCPGGSLYDQSQACCAHIPQSAEQSCVSLILETRKCVTNCAVYTKEDACNNHWHACQWHDEDKVCQVRP